MISTLHTVFIFHSTYMGGKRNHNSSWLFTINTCSGCRHWFHFLQTYSETECKSLGVTTDVAHFYSCFRAASFGKVKSGMSAKATSVKYNPKHERKLNEARWTLSSLAHKQTRGWKNPHLQSVRSNRPVCSACIFFQSFTLMQNATWCLETRERSNMWRCTHGEAAAAHCICPSL